MTDEKRTDNDENFRRHSNLPLPNYIQLNSFFDTEKESRYHDCRNTSSVILCDSKDVGVRPCEQNQRRDEITQNKQSHKHKVPHRRRRRKRAREKFVVERVPVQGYRNETEGHRL